MTVFFSRMLPIVRTFISLPAGVAKMPFWRFTAYTLLGSIPWVLALALVGEKVGENWEDWRHKLGYLDYLVLAAIVVGIVYLIVKRRRGGGDGEGEEPPELRRLRGSRAGGSPGRGRGSRRR